MYNFITNIAGTTEKIIGPAKNTVDLQEKEKRRVPKLIITNTHATQTVGLSLYLEDKSSAIFFIVGGLTSYLKIRPGYSVDIFENVPYIYSNVDQLKVKLKDAADTVAVLMNYEYIDIF
jgi:hypothetical protein